MNPPIIQIPCTGSCNGLTAIRAVSSQLRKRPSLISLALPEEHCPARSNSIAHLSCILRRSTCDQRVYTTRIAMVRTLFFLVTAFFAFAKIHAAPTRYDQRQDGNFNLDSKFENILFVVVFPSNVEKITHAAWNALDSVISRSKDQGLIKADEVHQEEPYSVEIINVNHLNKESSVRKAEGGEVETSNVSDQRPTFVEDKAERIARNVKNFDFPKSREVPTVPGYFVNVRKTPALKTGNGRARNVVGNVWNPDDEPGRPGTSLKKQLPRRGEENVASQSSASADKNNVSPFVEEKQQELKLVGDSLLENCGPGRHRDPVSLTCESDGSTAPPL